MNLIIGQVIKMFEEILIMIGFALFSFCISHILLRYTPEPLNKIVRILAMVGIIIHELLHVLMCILTNARIKEITLLGKRRYKGKEKENDDKFEYFGRVRLSDKRRLTFLQALLIGLAPLIFSFWLFFLLWEQILNPQLDIMLFFLYLFIMISTVLAAAPSFEDLTSIPQAFKNDPHYSLYQIFLSTLSIITVWIVIVEFQISFFHEIINYILIMIFYYIFKYSFRGLNELIYKIRFKNAIPSNRIKYRAYRRKRFKPTKPRKLGKREAPW